VWKVLVLFTQKNFKSTYAQYPCLQIHAQGCLFFPLFLSTLLQTYARETPRVSSCIQSLSYQTFSFSLGSIFISHNLLHNNIGCFQSKEPLLKFAEGNIARFFLSRRIVWSCVCVCAIQKQVLKILSCNLFFEADKTGIRAATRWIRARPPSPVLSRRSCWSLTSRRSQRRITIWPSPFPRRPQKWQQLGVSELSVTQWVIIFFLIVTLSSS